MNALKKLSKYFLLAVCTLSVLQACDKEISESEIQVEEGTVSVNGTEIFYKRMGEGEPVLIVHGGPVLDHSYLVSHFKPLAGNYELIYYDQRLSGRSSAKVDSTDITLDNFIEDIEELRKEMGIGKMHLMAHSWGGLLAMKYAIAYPSNLNSLVLLNSMPANTELWREESQMIAGEITSEDSLKRQELVRSDLMQNNPAEAIERLLLISYRSQFNNPSLADSLDFYIPEDYMSRSRRFGNLMADLMDYDLHSDLDSLQVHTLLIYGENEPATTLSGPVLDSTLPNSELIIIQNSGHFPFIEQPEDFIREVESFLGRYQ